MNRRNFLKMVPGVLAGVAVLGAKKADEPLHTGVYGTSPGQEALEDFEKLRRMQAEYIVNPPYLASNGVVCYRQPGIVKIICEDGDSE